MSDDEFSNFRYVETLLIIAGPRLVNEISEENFPTVRRRDWPVTRVWEGGIDRVTNARPRGCCGIGRLGYLGNHIKV